MPLAAVVDTLDAVPEAQRGLYKQDGEKFVLDLDGVETHPAALGLRRSRDEVLREAKEAKDAARDAKARLDAYEGIDPAEVKRLREVASAADKRSKDKDSELQTALASQRAEFDRQFAELRAERDRDRAAARDVRFEQELAEAALRGGVLKEDVKLVTRIIKGDRVRLNDTGRAIVVGPDGHEAPGVTLDDFFKGEFKKTYPKFYEASGSSGSGAAGGAPSGAPAGSKRVLASDAAGLRANAAGIAKGEVEVVYE